MVVQIEFMLTFVGTLTFQIQKMENQKSRRRQGKIIMKVYQMIETL